MKKIFYYGALHRYICASKGDMVSSVLRLQQFAYGYYSC
jgi:hypothetical protein